jgi:hypothetical protein
MKNEKYEFSSHATWPPDAEVSGNESTDFHPTREAAQGVCTLLERNGLGGDRQIFPTKTWVEPIPA